MQMGLAPQRQLCKLVSPADIIWRGTLASRALARLGTLCTAELTS